MWGMSGGFAKVVAVGLSVVALGLAGAMVFSTLDGRPAESISPSIVCRELVADTPYVAAGVVHVLLPRGFALGSPLRNPDALPADYRDGALSFAFTSGTEVRTGSDVQVSFGPEMRSIGLTISYGGDLNRFAHLDVAREFRPYTATLRARRDDLEIYTGVVEPTRTSKGHWAAFALDRKNGVIVELRDNPLPCAPDNALEVVERIVLSVRLIPEPFARLYADAKRVRAQKDAKLAADRAVEKAAEAETRVLVDQEFGAGAFASEEVVRNRDGNFLFHWQREPGWYFVLYRLGSLEAPTDPDLTGRRLRVDRSRLTPGLASERIALIAGWRNRDGTADYHDTGRERHCPHGWHEEAPPLFEAWGKALKEHEVGIWYLAGFRASETETFATTVAIARDIAKMAREGRPIWTLIPMEKLKPLRKKLALYEC